MIISGALRKQLPPKIPAPRAESVPLVTNYLFSALAGTIWYLQFFFYGMGTTKMGRFDFSSWTLHMASIIIFGTLLGVYLSEWKGVSKRAHRLMRLGLVVLVSSTVVIGYGNYLAKETTATAGVSDDAVATDAVGRPVPTDSRPDRTNQ